MTSEFIRLLGSTINENGYIPDEDTQETENLIAIFDTLGNLDEFLSYIESESNSEISANLLKFLKVLIEKFEITGSNVYPWILNALDFNSTNDHFDTVLIDICFTLSDLTEEEKGVFVKKVLGKTEMSFTTAEILLVRTDKHIKNDSLFIEVYLRALNTKKWNYLGLQWYQEAYIRIARSQEFSSFIKTLLTEEYERALQVFLDASDETWQLFFETIPPNKVHFESIEKLLTKDSKWDDFSRILVDYRGHGKRTFLVYAFWFLSKSGNILPFLAPCLQEPYGIYETMEYIGDYIRSSEIQELWDILSWEKIWGIVKIYEYIETRSSRSDKEQILHEIESIPWFKEEMENTRLIREKYKQSEEERIRNEEQTLRENITAMLTVVDKDDQSSINPELIDTYKKHKEIFTWEQIEIVRNHIQRFFGWNLFPLDKVEFTLTSRHNGSYSYSYTNNVWYREGFFLDTLEIAKDLHIDFPIHEKLVRALWLIPLGESARKILIPSVGNLSTADIEVLSSIYNGSRKDNLCEFMWWQGFFELFYAFETDWKREKENTRKILHAFIEVHSVEDYIREKAIEILYLDGIWEELTDLAYIQSLWEKEIEKYSQNLVETYHRWYDYVFKLNQILIEKWDRDAIEWRIQQLLAANVNLSDPWKNHENSGFARLISDLESELSHDHKIILWLRYIPLEVYEINILQIIRHALDLINQDKSQYWIYSNYLIWGMFEIIKLHKFISLDPLLRQIEGIIVSYPDKTNAKRQGGYKFSQLLKELDGNYQSEEQNPYENPELWEQDCSEKIRKLREEIDEKDTRITELERKNQGYKDAQLWWDPESPYIVFIEGKLGVVHLRAAWEGLYPWRDCPFFIGNWHSATQLANTLANWDDSGYQLVIWVFDADRQWLEAWGRNTQRCISTPKRVWDIWHWENTPPHQASVVHGITLPIHLDICSILSRDPIYMHQLVIDIQVSNLKKIKEIQYTAIEEMYYGIAGVPQDIFDNRGKFQPDSNPYWFTKNSLLRELLSLTQWPGKKLDKSELFWNFIPLFDKIYSIIRDHESSKFPKNNPSSNNQS